MTAVVVTTDVTGVYLSSNSSVTNTTLRVNSRGPFTLHFAIWPFAGLLFLITTVWILVYISTILARRHKPKIDQINSISLYVTQDSTIAGGNESSNVVSHADI